MNSGWVKTYRKLSEWEWYKDSAMVHLFIHLIIKANQKEGEWKGMTIKRGQLVTSRKILSAQTGISERSIRTCLTRLKTTSEITIKTTNKNSIITICNYDIYQSHEYKNDQQNDQQNANKTTNQHTRIYNKQEYKKYMLSEIDSDNFPELKHEYIEITKAFQKLFRANLIEAGASTKTVDSAKGTWIDSIRLMIESDGYSINDLRDVYQFLQKDAFWKQNILSTPKLREKMDKLKMKIKNGRTNSKEGTTWNELAEVISKFSD